MSQFPPAGFSTKEDSKYFGMSQEDPSVRPKAEGGFDMARARYKRRPRRKFTTGFTAISERDRQLLEAFWTQMKGGSKSFTWTLPDTGEEVYVRFEGKMTHTYVGQGETYLWDVRGIQLGEV